MEPSWQFFTVLPVLLGDGSSAGRVARRLWREHDVSPVRFGERRSFWADPYAKRHPLRLSSLPDRLITEALLTFASDPARRGKLLVLIPVSDRAAAYAARAAAALETSYVLLPPADGSSDPLTRLLWTNGTRPEGETHPLSTTP